jgi:hypothetical protein
MITGNRRTPLVEPPGVIERDHLRYLIVQVVVGDSRTAFVGWDVHPVVLPFPVDGTQQNSECVLRKEIGDGNNSLLERRYATVGGRMKVKRSRVCFDNVVLNGQHRVGVDGGSGVGS